MTVTSGRRTLKMVVGEYLYYRSNLRRSVNTLKADALVLGRFALFYDRQRRSPRNMTKFDIEEFLIGGGLMSTVRRGRVKEPSGRTINQYGIVLKGFLEWAGERDKLPDGLHRSIPHVTETQPELVRLMPDELAQMIASFDNLRDKTAAALNTHGFGRLSSVMDLKLRDVDLANNEIRWYEKKTDSYIPKPITPLLDRGLRKWLTAYPEEVGGYDDDWHVIPRRYCYGYGHAGWTYVPDLPATNLTKIFKEKTAPFIGDITGQGGSHTLRRSAALALILSHDNHEEGLSAAQYMLGHKNRAQTERYVGITANRLAAVKLLKTDFIPDLESATTLRSVGDGTAQAL